MARFPEDPPLNPADFPSFSAYLAAKNGSASLPSVNSHDSELFDRLPRISTLPSPDISASVPEQDRLPTSPEPPYLINVVEERIRRGIVDEILEDQDLLDYLHSIGRDDLLRTLGLLEDDIEIPQTNGPDLEEVTRLLYEGRLEDVDYIIQDQELINHLLDNQQFDILMRICNLGDYQIHTRELEYILSCREFVDHLFQTGRFDLLVRFGRLVVDANGRYWHPGEIPEPPPDPIVGHTYDGIPVHESELEHLANLGIALSTQSDHAPEFAGISPHDSQAHRQPEVQKKSNFGFYFMGTISLMTICGFFGALRFYFNQNFDLIREEVLPTSNSFSLGTSPQTDAQPSSTTYTSSADEEPQPQTQAAPENYSNTGISQVFTPEIQYWAKDIVRWSNQYGIPPNLLAVVMQMESCGDPRAISRAGASGLLQVMPFHFAVGENPFNPETNFKRGTSYLSRSLIAANGDTGQALAGYNGGIGVINHSGSWSSETWRYYNYGTQMLAEANSGQPTSSVIEAHYRNNYLCQAADARLGISP